MQPSVIRFWDQFRAVNPDAPAAIPPSFHFCGNQEDADLCATLVVAGRKRATAPSVAELRLAGDPLPQVGQYAIVTDWAGEPMAVIRTTSAEIRRFCEIDEEFARTEGEGDLTLEWWRTAHRAYYESVLAGSGYVVDDDLEIVCEKFDLVFTSQAAFRGL